MSRAIDRTVPADAAPGPASLRGRRVLLSTLSSDAHTWNLVYLQLLLEEEGCQVTNLGPCVPDDLLLATARRERPDAIVISSLNGHGYRDGARLVRAMRQDPVTHAIPVVIGGRLGIRGALDHAQVDALLAAGCDAVFDGRPEIGLALRRLAILAAGHPRRGAA